MGIALPWQWLIWTGIRPNGLESASALLTPPLVGVVAFWLHSSPRVGICLCKEFLNIPCPGCGITTGLVAILHGDLRSSLAANACAVIVAALLAGQVLLASGELVGLSTRQARYRLASTGSTFLLFALLGQWAWSLTTVH